MCVYVCVLALESLREANHFVGPHILKKEAILGLTVRAGITVKLGHFCGFD